MRNFLPAKLLRFVPLILVIVLAASLRWLNLNWDNGFHLQPDERFLVMVQGQLSLPESFSNYLDPNASTLNPQNEGSDFFVYGTFPLTLNKLISLALQTDTYDLALPQGRLLSGLADIGTVIMVYLLAQLAWGDKKGKQTVGFWAAGLYAVAVLPIQLSHFFAADSFLCFFVTASVWSSWRYALQPKWRHLAQAGVWFGLALGSKLTAAFLAPVIGLAIAAPHLAEWISAVKPHHWFLKWSWRKILHLIIAGGWWLLIAYCTVRLASPNYFATANWLDPHLNPRFINSLQQLKSFEGDETWFPPAIQWIHKPPVWFALKNIAVYGVGLPWFGLMVVGVGVVLWHSWQRWRSQTLTIKDWLVLVLLGWMLCFFIYQSTQFVKVIRYFNLLYPGLALLAGFGFSWLITKLNHVADHSKKSWQSLAPVLRDGFIGGIILAVLIWPAAFISIYLHEHSRVTASKWLNQNLPENSYILSEYWDDALPLHLPEATRQFQGEQITVFDQDTPEKWAKLSRTFMSADYYVLSSNRAWASIMAAPDKYPQMSAYYRGLLADQTNWQLLHTVTNYPSLKYLGIPVEFNTDGADEAFTVYDHPKVLVFGKRK